MNPLSRKLASLGAPSVLFCIGNELVAEPWNPSPKAATRDGERERSHAVGAFTMHNFTRAASKIQCVKGT